MDYCFSRSCEISSGPLLPVQKKNDFGATGVRTYERIAAVRR